MNQSLFRFEVSDSTGRVRRGTIRGTSLEAAKAEIEEKGFSILLLEPETESVPSRRPSEPSLKYDLTLWERLSFPEIPKPVEIAVLALLVFTGCLFLARGFGSREVQGSHSQRLARTERNVSIQGRFLSPPSPGTVLWIRFPQLPYEVKVDYGTVSTADGEFLWNIPFKSTRTPSLCDFKVLRNGRTLVSRDSVLLEGTTLVAILEGL